MNFLLAEDLIEFREVLRALLAEVSAAERKGSFLDPYTGEPLEQRPFSATVWKKVVDAGVLAAALPETVAATDVGGLGLGSIALQVMLEETGRSLVPLPVFEALVFGALPLLAVENENAASLLADLAAGTRRFAGAFYDPSIPPLRATVGDSNTVIDGELGFVSSVAQCTELLVFAEHNSELALYAVDLSSLEATTIPTLDLIRRYSGLKLTATPATRIGPITQAGAARLRQRQQLGCVAELAGIGARALEMTVDYVKTRQQFGRPIGSFQAVQHKLADMLLRVEQTTSLGRFAAWAADNDNAQLEAAALAAKGFASEVIPLVAEQAIQAHGGIGFTYEYDLHLFLRRARVLSALAGASESAYEQLGSALLG